MLIFQSFHWYSKNDGKLWRKLRNKIPEFKEIGITHIWLPPPTRAKRGRIDSINESKLPEEIQEYINSFLPDVGEVGYSILSLFDLNNTKYGNEIEFRQLIKEMNEANIVAIVDVVLNHRTCGVPRDIESMEYDCDLFNTNDRKTIIGEAKVRFPIYKEVLPNGEIIRIDGKYYNSIGYNLTTIARIKGKSWSDNVSQEYGNYDHLLGINMDLNSKFTQDLYKKWFKWMIQDIHVGGFRVDAVKHMDSLVIKDIFQYVKELNNDCFLLCEVWNGDENVLKYYEKLLNAHVFNVNQHFRFYDAARLGNCYDLRNILSSFDGVPFVDNHDTQPSQDLESYVECWFKLSAYSLLLLRNTSPILFIADYEGALYNATDKDTKRGNYPVAIPKLKYHIDFMLKLRKDGFIMKKDYFDHPNCIGWTTNKFIVVINNGTSDMSKFMQGTPLTKYQDILQFRKELIKTDSEGYAEFISNSGAVSIWVPVDDFNVSLNHISISHEFHSSSQ